MSFSILFSETYWFPRDTVDNSKSVEEFNLEDGTRHIAKLEKMAKSHIGGCNAFCRVNASARRELDKPNLHRLLELCMHSIPALGHVRHFNELVFECAHQPLKRAMSKSSFHESHIQGIDNAIADDWKARISVLLSDLDNPDSDRDAFIDSAMNLLCGRGQRALRLLSAMDKMRELTFSVLKRLPLHAVLKPRYGMKMNADRIWVPSLIEDEKSISFSLRSHIHGILLDYAMNVTHKSSKFYKRASRVIVSGAGTHPEVYKFSTAHDVVYHGSVVQALVSDSMLPLIDVKCIEDDHTEVHCTLQYLFIEAIFCIETFFSSEKGRHITAMAAVKRCPFLDNG